MNISFDGINESIVSFNVSGNIEPGNLVYVISDNTVKKCPENSHFIGICISCRNNLAAIQISGFAQIKIADPCSVKYGRQFFRASKDASLSLATPSDENALPLQVVSIDKTNSIIGVFLQ